MSFDFTWTSSLWIRLTKFQQNNLQRFAKICVRCWYLCAAGMAGGTWQCYSLCLFMVCLPEAFASEELCCLGCSFSWPTSHHATAALTCLKFCSSVSWCHFPLPPTLRHLTSPRRSPQLQCDYHIARAIHNQPGKCPQNCAVDFLKQEEILAIDMSLLFYSLLIITETKLF